MKTLEARLRKHVEVGNPVLIWGMPGVGKTERVVKLAEREGWHIETVILSVRMPEDIGGLPVRTDGGVKLYPPAWALNVIKAAEEGKKPVVFLDELSTALPQVQAAALRVVHEGVVGDTRLPDSVRFIAAANPPHVAAGGFDLTPPMANRFAHIDYEPTLEEWRAWAVGRSPAHARVAAFLNNKPGLLLSYPENDPEQAGRAWASPRTWDRAARILAAYRMDAVEAADDIAAEVGIGPAGEFVAWARMEDLIPPEVALRDPENVVLPNREDAVYSLAIEAVSYVSNNIDSARGLWVALLKLLSRIYMAGRKDIAAAALTMAVPIYQSDPTLPLDERALAPFGDYVQKYINPLRGEGAA